jgi:membrane associated rhomboid family serine protease
VFAVPATTLARMLSDRPYLRGNYQREKTSALTWMLSATIAGFLLQVVLGSNWLSGAGDRVDNLFALTIPAFQDGWYWTLLTHAVLHSPGFIFHVVGNCVALFFLGRELIPALGTRRFVGLYAAATIVGGLAWTAVHYRFGSGELIGATAAIDALIVVYACLQPDTPLHVLLFFVFPVTIKPRHIAYLLAGFDLVIFLAYELPGVRLPYNASIASSAHLGGMLTGLFFYRVIHRSGWFNQEDRGEVELPRWIRRTPRPAATKNEGESLLPSSRADLKAEVDRILDKINSQGIGALTPEEKRILDDAKHLLSQQ